MHLVRVGKDYNLGEYVRYLRNCPDFKSSFIQQEDITEQQQIEYMSTHGEDYWVCYDKWQPVGFIGVVDSDLRLAVHPEYQKYEYGTFMINEMKKMYNFTVKVRKDNHISQKFFTKLNIDYKLV
jgi:ribosomal protein S18 acetylase RimI-like enzyme